MDEKELSAGGDCVAGVLDSGAAGHASRSITSFTAGIAATKKHKEKDCHKKHKSCERLFVLFVLLCGYASDRVCGTVVQRLPR